jgi:hypothetical protein
MFVYRGKIVYGMQFTPDQEQHLTRLGYRIERNISRYPGGEPAFIRASASPLPEDQVVYDQIRNRPAPKGGLEIDPVTGLPRYSTRPKRVIPGNGPLREFASEDNRTIFTGYYVLYDNTAMPPHDYEVLRTDTNGRIFRVTPAEADEVLTHRNRYQTVEINTLAIADPINPIGHHTIDRNAHTYGNDLREVEQYIHAQGIDNSALRPVTPQDAEKVLYRYTPRVGAPSYYQITEEGVVKEVFGPLPLAHARGIRSISKPLITTPDIPGVNGNI